MKSDHLKRHINSTHLKIKNIKCQFCDKYFGDKYKAKVPFMIISPRLVHLFLAVKCCSTNLADLFIVLVVRRQYIRPIDNRIFKNRKLLNLILLEFSSSKIFWFSQKYLMSIGNGFNSKTDLKIESKVTNKNISDAKYY